MTAWYEFSESFYAMTIAAIIGALMLCCRICYKCKFDTMNLCGGLLQCHRNVTLEQEIDIENPQRDEIPTPSMSYKRT